MTRPTRVATGVPTGGEFSRYPHADAGMTLDDEPETAAKSGANLGDDVAGPAHVVGMSNQEIPVTAVELTYQEGTSDKFYRVFSVNESVLTCQYGRAGTYGVFTPRKAAADPGAAAKAADKAVAGKAAKGYQIVRSGSMKFDHIPTDSELDSMLNTMPAGKSAEVATPQLREQSAVTIAANTGEVDPAVLPRVVGALESYFGPHRPSLRPSSETVVPMLAQIATKAEVDFMLSHPAFIVQPKLDGDRVLIVVEDGVVSAYNRSGQPKAKNIGEAHLAPFRSLTQGRWSFDGEVVGRTLHVFDMPAAAGYTNENTSYNTRAAALIHTMRALEANPADVAIVDIACDETEKRAMLAAAKDGHKEEFGQQQRPVASCRRSCRCRRC